MLIASPRHTPQDLQAWRDLERYDVALGASERMDALEADAVATIRDWLTTANNPYASMSWGKDSVCVAHLAHLADPTVPLRAVRVADWEPPETDWTRDAYLDTHPGTQYEEAIYNGTVPQRGEPGFEEVHSDPNRKPTNIMRALRGDYISGVRAEESRMRAQSLLWHGVATGHTCRPIIKWRATDVFAYLHSRRLPVHPVYAMSYGGAMDRRWLRVYILGSTKPTLSKRDSASWEDRYYGDVLAAARRNRAHMWAAS